MLKIYNTLTKKKESFIPIDENNVRYYSCGPTVYNNIHIGNARAFVCADLLAKVLKGIYKKVTFVSNITDIDDKIIEASVKEKISIKELSKRYFEQYKKDTKFLGIDDPDNQPFATDFIKEMIDFINVLIDKDAAYVANGNVLFRVKSFKNYGILSERIIQEQDSGSRVDVETYKEDPNDFTLWKPSTDDEPGWDSPWGLGRPGWHLECSVMSEKYLGKNFDIHGGGLDLVFPHHENEIAQSCCANKTDKFANYWLHNGYVTYNKEKMSKSLGNIVTMQKMKNKINGQVIRLALLSSHYKQPLDWNEKLVSESQSTLDKWYSLYEPVKDSNLDDNLLSPLLEDLNTPGFIAKLHLLYEKASKGDKSSKKLFLEGCKLIGLMEENQESWKNFKKTKINIDENTIELKIKERESARKKGNYKLADDIRKELEDNGISIEDKNNKTIWKYK